MERLKDQASLLKSIETLYQQQLELQGDPSDPCSPLLAKLMRIDTIPFCFYGHHSSIPFSAEGDIGGETFQTWCFRIEAIHKQEKNVLLSLLQPFTIYGEPAGWMEEIYALKRTDCLIAQPVPSISSLSCLNIDLMKRDIIMEPKW